MKNANTKFILIIIVAIVLFAISLNGSLAQEKSILKLLEPSGTYGRAVGENIVDPLKVQIVGTHGIVSTGHWRATQVGMDILKKGGNAFDAGVAAAMALKSMKYCIAGIAGVAPLVLYSAREGQVTTRVGVGPAPAKCTYEYFIKNGLPRSWYNPFNGIVPADIDTWLAALERFGTKSFEEVAQGIIEIAEEGYHMYKSQWSSFRRYGYSVVDNLPYTKAFWDQHGEGKQKVDDIMVNKDLGKLFRYMVDAERRTLAAGGTRSDAIWAARDAFYKGQPAKDMDRFYKEHPDLDGYMTYEDFANFNGDWMPPLHTNYRGVDVYCSQVTQAGVMILMLNMLENFDLQAMGYNTPEYIHVISQVINLAMQDRYRWMGDPKFVDVPRELWSKEYARERIKLIDMEKAFKEPPQWGDPKNMKSIHPDSPTMFLKYPHTKLEGLKDFELAEVYEKEEEFSDLTGTTSLNVMDGQGNIFSMTESDPQSANPWIPGWGFGIGSRGIRFQIDPVSNGVVAAGKRPRCTNVPYLAMKDGKPLMGFSTPGSDDQPQSLLQFFLNVVEWGMEPQQAVEQPRFSSGNFIESDYEICHQPGVLRLQKSISQETFKALGELGHNVKDAGLFFSSCTVTYRDPETGYLKAGAGIGGGVTSADGW